MMEREGERERGGRERERGEREKEKIERQVERGVETEIWKLQTLGDNVTLQGEQLFIEQGGCKRRR